MGASRFLALVLLLPLGACEAVIPQGVIACESDDDCPGSLKCAADARCYSPDSEALADVGDGDGDGDSTVVDTPGSGDGDGDTGDGDAGDGDAGDGDGDAGDGDGDTGDGDGDTGDGDGDAGDGDGDAGDGDGDAGDGDGDTDPVTTVDELVQALFGFACDAAAHCEPKIGFDVTAAARPFCHPAAGLNLHLERVEDAIAAGNLTYDAQAATDCIAGLPTELHCSLPNDLPAECDDVFDGSVAEGEPCLIQEECEGALVCLGEGGDCPGSCVPLRTADQSCDDDDDCATDLVCADGICLARVDRFDDCVADVQCPQDYACQSDTCLSVPGQGESCWVRDYDCGGELVCDELSETTDPIGTCGRGVEVGGACGDIRVCGVGARCVDGTCVAISPLDGTCAGGDCPPTTYCTDGSCLPRPVTGEACEVCVDCATCVEGACGEDRVCVLANDMDFCLHDPESPYDNCQGYCMPVPDGPDVCAPKQSAGASCAKNDECDDVEGLVCDDDTGMCATLTCD